MASGVDVHTQYISEIYNCFVNIYSINFYAIWYTHMYTNKQTDIQTDKHDHIPSSSNKSAGNVPHIVSCFQMDRAAPILVSVSVSGQYQHILMVSESVKYIIQVPILLFMQYYP